jgi:hypothetical protein
MAPLVLIPLLLLPGACAAHPHHAVNDHDPSGQDRSPHFHLRLLATHWPAFVEDQPTVGNEETALDESAPESDHDADAVYLGLSVLMGGQPDSPDGHHAVPAPMVSTGVVCLFPAPAPVSWQASAAPGVAYLTCPLHLSSCALLI